MTIYTIDNNKEKTILIYIICLKYTDYESLTKLFSLLRVIYHFSPICVNSDYAIAQINALKLCKIFKNKPYVITCLFHFSQSLIKKLKYLKIIKKKMTKRSYEILRNIKSLCFIEKYKIKRFFKYLKEEIFTEDKEKNLCYIF